MTVRDRADAVAKVIYDVSRLTVIMTLFPFVCMYLGAKRGIKDILDVMRNHE